MRAGSYLRGRVNSSMFICVSVCVVTYPGRMDDCCKELSWSGE